MWPAGVQGRGSPPGPSRPPDSARRRGSLPRWRTASWSSRPPCPAPRCCSPTDSGPPSGAAMVDRPYVLLSCSMSIDGYLGGPSTDRLVLSNAADLDRVDAVRAGCDAILVGANTVRLDNPRLAVRSQERRARRQLNGEPASPIKVTVTGGGQLDPG